MLAPLENMVVAVNAAPYLRLYAWWICLQHWRTLRFSEHRGINPSSILFSGMDFVATLSHSKTLGRDKKVQSWPVVVRGLAFIAVPGLAQSWMGLVEKYGRIFNEISCSQHRPVVSRVASDLNFGMIRVLHSSTGFDTMDSLLGTFFSPYMYRILRCGQVVA